jgi:LmbE family N-acetylglucosaminyl deacetylase
MATQLSMGANKKLLFVAAHPDDAEFCAGGLISLWHQAGHSIKILCLTNGNAGHHVMAPKDLAQRRAEEARTSARLVAAELEIWDQADGELTASIELRQTLITAIRLYEPDLIVTHRVADYHPDHRATGQLVQDSAYLLQVPAIVPKVQAMQKMPAILLAYDRFKDPRPHRLDWIIDIKTQIDKVLAMLACHRSQVFEWLPRMMGQRLTATEEDAWLKKLYLTKPKAIAKKARELSPAETKANTNLAYAEAFEISEYGGAFDASDFNFFN